MKIAQQEEVCAESFAGAAEGVMSLVDHLQEFRQRLIKVIIAIVIASSCSYIFSADIVAWMTQPAGKLYYMHPAEAFFTYMKVAVVVGFLITLPVTMYQVWAFLLPALKKREKHTATFFMLASVVLFVLGLVFAYFFALPAGVRFMLGFESDNLQPLFSIGDYVSFVLSFLLPFGLIFELPLFILVAAHFGLVSGEFLKAKRKAVLVLAFIVGAILSPTPDILSQTLVAVPLMVLYELSHLIVRYILHK
ncbi:sec-independent protein translocase protein TatC [Sporomusaceae bacterium BoRhaA]|uniref:twin-arginine translocase subunit TatC n=1 Tax=Pelorhabdus rhamnosifermentans TaxID=2772457 RepID=UPI001C0647BC|nr:twin-arginine translocase subunit TatC [Pelorhabdus rhamnosifermentans]MBU2700641.1 sec-independent protein translocase protein TatC [Pelorhabdus rhamnosifermentans]